MNKQECIRQIFNEVMFSNPDHPLTILCCFHSRRDMQKFCQSLCDEFAFSRKTKINLGTVSDCFSATVGNDRIFVIHDNCKCTDGISPDLFYYQEGEYYSDIIDYFRFRTKYVKNSKIYSFE